MAPQLYSPGSSNGNPASEDTSSNPFVKYQVVAGTYAAVTGAGLYRVYRLPVPPLLKAQRYRGVLGGTTLAAAVAATGLYVWFDAKRDGGLGSSGVGGAGGVNGGGSAGSGGSGGTGSNGTDEGLDKQKVAASQRD